MSFSAGVYGAGVYGAGIYGIGDAGPALRVVPPGKPRIPTLLVRVTAPNGTWCYLDHVGRVSGLSYSWSYPGGPMAASWSLDVRPGARVPALVEGAKVEVLRGPSTVWRGKVATLDPGTPRRVTCDGIGSAPVHEPVKTTGSLNAIVDASIAAGMPLTRPGSLSTRAWSGNNGGQDLATTTLDRVLTDVLLRDSKRWAVSVGGVITAVADPTVVTVMVRADTIPPTTLADYASEVTVKYQSSSGTYLTVTVTNPAAVRFGRVAKSLDMSSSVMTSSEATAAGQAWLAKNAPSITLAGDLTLTRGQAITATSGAVDLPSFRPGVLARVLLMSQWRDTFAVPTSSIDMIVGGTTYNADDGTLAISPVNRAPSPGEVILGAAA